MTTITSWGEYRAIVRRPASSLDSDEARDLGYVAFAGPPRKTREEALQSAQQGSEETLASVIGMQYRVVTADAWEEIEL